MRVLSFLLIVLSLSANAHSAEFLDLEPKAVQLSDGETSLLSRIHSQGEANILVIPAPDSYTGLNVNGHSLNSKDFKNYQSNNMILHFRLGAAISAVDFGEFPAARWFVKKGPFSKCIFLTYSRDKNDPVRTSENQASYHKTRAIYFDLKMENDSYVVESSILTPKLVYGLEGFVDAGDALVEEEICTGKKSLKDLPESFSSEPFSIKFIKL